MTKAHVVMVNDWMAYLTQPAATQFNLATGARIELPQSLVESQGGVTIVAPDGNVHELSLRESDEAARFRFSNTRLPGRYVVRFTGTDGESQSVPFQVARDAQESNLTQFTEEQETAMMNSAGVTFAEPGTLEIPEVVSREHDRPVWTPLLVGLLIMLGVELLLATRSARSRAGEVSLPTFIENGIG